jgi:hypothetical protein
VKITKIINSGSASLMFSQHKINRHCFFLRCIIFKNINNLNRLGGSNFSLLSDKRILVAKIIEMTFGEKEQLNFADFRA